MKEGWKNDGQEERQTGGKVDRKKGRKKTDNADMKKGGQVERKSGRKTDSKEGRQATRVQIPCNCA